MSGRSFAQAAAAPADAATQPAPIVIDDFSDVSKWKVVASDGVEGKISLAEGTTCPEGKDGKSLRLDFDFKKGSGYCIVRRELDLELPENYRVSYWLHGSGHVNDLEFKFYDHTGDNVWWNKKFNHAYIKAWEQQRLSRAQIEFAWGPGGGRETLKQVSAIEVAVTAGTGGSGYVLIDSLTLEPLPPRSPIPQPITVSVNNKPVAVIPAGETEVRDIPITMRDHQATIALDFGAPREFGGLLLEWNDDLPATSLDGEISINGTRLEPWQSPLWIDESEPTLLPGNGSDAMRVVVTLSCRAEASPHLRRILLLPQDVSLSANGRMKFIAQASPRGWYPRQFLSEQVAWSPVGAPDDEFEALLGSDGQVEITKGGLTIEPFVHTDGHLLTWADFRSMMSLPRARLPMPSVELAHTNGLTIRVEPTSQRLGGTAPHAVVRYTLTNTGSATAKGTLALALRPIQALPWWHTLNIAGGVSQDSAPYSHASATPDHLTINGFRLLPSEKPSIAWLGKVRMHDIISTLANWDGQSGRLGNATSGALGFDFNLAPGQSHTIWVHALHSEPRMPETSVSALNAELERQSNDWTNLLSRITLKLPPQARELEDSFYAQIGWILVNKDGPAIQPGSRTYDRTWIRDGALTATALLYTGHASEVKEFLDWFRTFQYEDGKVPCCVDQRGPDPVPEHDSHGQYIYGVATYHRFTHDDDLLKRHWGNVAAAVGYIEKLRATRMTAEFADPNARAETRVKFGLMPESISHEGYSAKPMHSYWDDFFTLRGLTDAVYIAAKLGENETAAKWTVLRDDFARTLVDSIRLAQKIKNVQFVPGCAELGDEDATSTAAAIFPGAQADGPLADSLRVTFDRYINRFRDRRDGRIEWRDYTPYEMRNASALLMLGHPDQAHEVLDWMLQERASIGWREWAEIGYKDKKTGKFVGDMPHTWVGSDYVKAVRNLCVYERELDHALVIGAGLKPEWLADKDGVTIGGFPTEYGTLSYKASMTGNTITIDIEAGTLKVPPGGLVLMPMTSAGIRSATINGKPAAETGSNHVIVREVPAKVEIVVN